MVSFFFGSETMKATFVGQVPELGVIVLLSLSHLIDEVAIFFALNSLLSAHLDTAPARGVR